VRRWACAELEWSLIAAAAGGDLAEGLAVLTSPALAAVSSRGEMLASAFT
jgi:hypothetical protein